MHLRPKQVVVLWVLFLLLGLSGCSEKNSDPEEKITRTELVEKEDASDEEKPDSQKESIFVYVCGQVASPGVYELPMDARIFEALDAAGGVLPDGAADSLNLAQKAEDGLKVYVPSREEAAENPAISDPDAGAQPGTGKVNLNTAGMEELMTLTGIGKTRAEAILTYREEQGNFESPEEIMEVEGIKEGIYEKLKDEITV